MAKGLVPLCTLACAILLSGCKVRMAPLAPAPPVDQDLDVCIAVGLDLTDVQAIYKPATADTLVWHGGKLKPFSAVHTVTSSYILEKPFWKQGKSLTFSGKQYHPTDRGHIQRRYLTRIGAYSGSGVFAQVGSNPKPTFIYLPLRPGCYFQEYKR
jgi:hypothetical protein